MIYLIFATPTRNLRDLHLPRPSGGEVEDADVLPPAAATCSGMVRDGQCEGGDMFSVTNVDDGVAEVHPHPRVERARVQHVGLQSEHAELVGAGVEALLQ